MQPSKMQMLKTLMPKDKTGTLVWHNLLPNSSFSISVHPNSTVFVLLESGNITTKIGGVSEDHVFEDTMTLLTSPKGTSFEMTNNGKETIDFFVIEIG